VLLINCCEEDKDNQDRGCFQASAVAAEEDRSGANAGGIPGRNSATRGLKESIAIIGDALGRDLDEIQAEIEPVIANTES